MSTSKKIFVILGMHRSGTSAISRALKVFDIELGQNLMPAYEGVNEKGFWEDLDIYQLNEEMLTSLGLNWDALYSVTEEQTKQLIKIGYLEKAISLLNNKLSTCSSGKFGFKDPRVTKLFGFWSKVLNQVEADVFYIFTVRSPLSISESLRKRDLMTYEKSLHLWFEYVKTPFNYLTEREQSKVLFINYEELMENPIEAIEELSQKLKIDINKEDLNYYSESFLTKKLKHHDVDTLKNKENIPTYLFDFYELLKNGSTSYLKLLSFKDDLIPKSALFPLFEYSDLASKEAFAKYQKLEIENDDLKSDNAQLKLENELIKNSRIFKFMRMLSTLLGRE